MDFNRVLGLLDYNTRLWVSSLTVIDIADILTAVYKVPNITQALRTPVQIASDLPTHVGQKGEKKFEDLCKGLPANYNTINTTKQGHAGDFIIEFHQAGQVYRILVDIKNYKNTVPRKEIDKFDYDLQYGQYDAGLIISYASKFAGIPDNIYMDDRVLPNGIVPVLFLADTPTEFIKICIQVLATKICVDQQKQSSLDKMQACLQSINNALIQSSTTRRLLSDLNISITQQINKCHEYLIGGEVQIKQAIKTIQQELQRNHHPITIVPHNWIDDLPHIPNVPHRKDNIEDQSCITTKWDFPPPLIETSLEESEELDFITDKYASKDISLIMQLTSMSWDEVLQTSDGKSADFIGKVVFELIPKKTMTKIKIDKKHEKQTPTDLLNMMTEKRTHYIATLNQSIINIIRKYSCD